MLTLLEYIGMSFYGLAGFGTFIRGNFNRQLSIARAQADPNESQKAVHAALWEVRTTFEGLFKEQSARRNALNLFSSLRDLPEQVEDEKPAAIVSYRKLATDAVLWPIMMPMNASRKAAINVAAAEAQAVQAQKDSFDILADHEEFSPLADALRSHDEERIGNAIIAKAKFHEQQMEAERVSPELSLSK